MKVNTYNGLDIRYSGKVRTVITWASKVLHTCMSHSLKVWEFSKKLSIMKKKSEKVKVETLNPLLYCQKIVFPYFYLL